MGKRAKVKKVNPRRRPVTEADVRKAKKEALSKAVDTAWAILFTVLRDKEGMDNEHLHRVWDHVNKLSVEISESRVSVKDLMDTLREEAGLTLGDLSEEEEKREEML